MPTLLRYERLEKIAAGSFAVVYRGRDRELHRDVAIKQIHPQFLADQDQLTRYWQEARLLASIEHPNVLTIYDIVRPRGWLVLERMHGNLEHECRGEGVDLDYLRVVLIDCLQALRFLHANGVIHGDIKPSNLLVDVHGRVKLGDFGLARRVNNETGSMLKGTTKYMAPELASEQFGPVGPSSDLYSLGFLAYEMLCGARFECLFPGLSVFGRDRQIAWMMWHTAADRRLPEIDRVLEGVPKDLARVIERLAAKEQTERYDSADAAIEDLHSGSSPAASSAPKGAKSEASNAAGLQVKRRRYIAVTAVALSAVLCVAMLARGRPVPSATSLRVSGEGVITAVYPEEWRVVIAPFDSDETTEVKLDHNDHLFLNEHTCLLRDLRVDDQLVVKANRDESGRQITEIHATRPIEHTGRIQTLEVDAGYLTLLVKKGESAGRELRITVPGNATVTINGQSQSSGKPYTLGQLRAKDPAVVHYNATERGRFATHVKVWRAITVKGVLQQVNLEQEKLTVAVTRGKSTELLKLPWAPRCEILVNGRRLLGERLLKPADLRPGDKAALDYDTHVRRISASRTLKIAGMIHSLQYAMHTLHVAPSGGKPVAFLVSGACKAQLGGEAVDWGLLRVGDRVEASYDETGAKLPEILHLSAQRPADLTRWALVIGTQNYEDLSIRPLPYSATDAVLVRNVLVSHYRVPTTQVLLMTDQSALQLAHGIVRLLRQIGPEGKLVVYYVGHARLDSEGSVFLTAKDTNAQRLGETAIPLQWLVDELEGCTAKEKLLLLDGCWADAKTDMTMEPSSEEMLRTLRASSQRPPLRTLSAMASCRAGQRGLVDPKRRHGLFALSLSEGFSGKADTNIDGCVEPTELFKRGVST